MAEDRVGKYTIVEEIASGRQGAVYRAFDPDTGRIVAVKILHPEVARDPSFVERFRREARIAASIDHPNVVKLFDVGESEGRLYIALEFFPESLARVVETGGQMPISRAAGLAAQIADGLAAAHARGIVHRDVKPGNVLIAPDGTAKVTDFGIARAESLATMTAIGTQPGTPHYMSPEQAEGERADARSDIYALGCVLYEMLVGEVPFTGTTPTVVLRRHVDHRATPVQERRSGIPGALAQIVERAMEKDRERRFQTAAEMAQAIRAAVPGLEPAGEPDAADPSPPERSAERPPVSPPSRPARGAAAGAPSPPPPPRRLLRFASVLALLVAVGAVAVVVTLMANTGGGGETVKVVEKPVIVEKVVPGPKVVETVIVEKQVPGETVIQTVIVEKQVTRVEKVVETVVVEKLIPGETVIQTVVVENLVPGPKVVETVIVEQTVIVAKVVEVAVVETVVVEELVVVTATPTATPAAAPAPTPSQAPLGLTFTIGSTTEDVLKAQGNPDTTDDNVGQKWFYGSSWVQFDWPSRGKKVIGWDNTGGNLKLKSQPVNGTFTIGSTTEDVLRAQGNPDTTDDNVGQKWFYGSSWVQLDWPSRGKKVIGWDNSAGNLWLTSTPAATPTPTHTLTPTPTFAPTPTLTPSPTPRPSPTPTPTPKPRGFGPVSGRLFHDPDLNAIKTYSAGVDLDDFTAEATFFNPYGYHSWDYGFIFRRSKDAVFEIVVVTNGQDWYHYARTGPGGSDALVSKGFWSYPYETFTNLQGDLNRLRLVIEGGSGEFFVNGNSVATLTLEQFSEGGDVQVVTGYFSGNQFQGGVTRFEDFTVTPLD